MSTTTNTQAMKTVNTLEFKLFYDNFFCTSGKSLDKLIKLAVAAFKDEPKMRLNNATYSIKMGHLTIATIKCINNTIVIE